MATIRRLFKQGNSVVVSIPGWMLEQNGLAVKDQVLIESVEPRGVMQLQKWNPPKAGEVRTAGGGGRRHSGG